MEQKYIVAFEIGSSGVKGAIGTVHTDNPGHVDILAVETEPLVDKVRYGCVENPGDVATCVTSICHKLQETSGVSPRIIKEVYVGISGRSLAAVRRDVERDFHAEIEITRKVIEELMEKASARPFPDREVVAVTPGVFQIDSQSHADPVGMMGHSLAATVNLVVCKPKIRNNLKRVFHERCSLNIADYVVTPLAVGRQLLTVEERRLGVMLVDCGAETTTVSIYRNGSLVYLATIPMGSRNITRDITTLNCLPERAEELKKAIGNAMPADDDVPSLVTDGLDNSEINRIVAARADEIISNIFEQITYAQLKPEQIPAGIVVTGGGSHLRGFNELMAQRTHMKVRQASLGTGIRIIGTGFNPAAALDVISIIAETALDNPVDCTVFPPDYVANGIDDRTSDIAGGSSIPANHEAYAPGLDNTRINPYMDDIDDSILTGDAFPEDEINQGKPAKNPERKKSEKVETPEKTPEKPKKKGANLWTSMRSKIEEMLTDNTDFEE